MIIQIYSRKIPLINTNIIVRFNHSKNRNVGKIIGSMEMVYEELCKNVMIWFTEKSDSKEIHLIHEIFMAQKLIEAERRR